MHLFSVGRDRSWRAMRTFHLAVLGASSASPRLPCSANKAVSTRSDLSSLSSATWGAFPTGRLLELGIDVEQPSALGAALKKFRFKGAGHSDPKEVPCGNCLG